MDLYDQLDEKSTGAGWSMLVCITAGCDSAAETTCRSHTSHIVMRKEESQLHSLWLQATLVKCLSPVSWPRSRRFEINFADIHQGTETTAVALVYVSYHLALREDMWKSMRLEIGTADLEAGNFIETLRGMPYLNAFIRVRQCHILAVRRAHLLLGNTKSSWACPRFL